MPRRKKRKQHAGMFGSRENVEKTQYIEDDSDSADSADERHDVVAAGTQQQPTLHTHFQKKKGRQRGCTEAKRLRSTDELVISGSRRAKPSTQDSATDAPGASTRMKYMKWTAERDEELLALVRQKPACSRTTWKSVDHRTWTEISSVLGGNPNSVRLQYERRVGRRRGLSPSSFARP